MGIQLVLFDQHGYQKHGHSGGLRSPVTQTEFHASLNERRPSPHPTADITRLDNTFPPITPAELNVTPAELKNIIKCLKHKAPGITATQLQHLPDNMIQQLAYTYNLFYRVLSTHFQTRNNYIYTEIRPITTSCRKLLSDLTDLHTRQNT